MRQSCCIKIADFPMKCEEMRDSSLRDTPYVIIRDGRITHISASAAKAGVDFKMSGDLVKTVYPSVRVLPYDSELYSSIHTDFLDVYADCSPAVEPVKEGEVFIDLTGVRDEAAEIKGLVDKVRTRSRVPGIYMAICSSTSKLVSRIGANLVAIYAGAAGFQKRFGRHIRDASDDFVFVKVKDELKADFIKGLPVQYLWSADRADIDKLYRLGVKRIYDIRRIPISVLATQIGDSAYRIYELSYGIDSTPVYPCYPEMELCERRVFGRGISEIECLISVLDDMLEALIKRLADTNMTTSGLILEVHWIDSGKREMTSLTKKLKHHTASQSYIRNALRQAVSEIVAGNGFAGSTHLSSDTDSPREWEIEEICIRFKGIKSPDLAKVDLFDDLERRERKQRLQKAMLSIERRFGVDKIELAGKLACSRHDQLRAVLDMF